jgi:hypothetical protein
MNSLWLLTQSKENGYDTYDSCVVVALTITEARNINPDGEWKSERKRWTAWAHKPTQVTVEYLGKASNALEAGTIVCSSFNAG